VTAEWYDLGQRLHAARTGAVVNRLLHSPVPAVPAPVAVAAHTDRYGITVTAATPGQPATTTHGADALALLGALGVSIVAEHPRTLVTDDPATLPSLLALARAAALDGPHTDTAAHIAWWADRADFPGGMAVIPLLDACRRRWITGATPDAEHHPGTWRAWLKVDDASCAAALTVLDRLTDQPPLPLLDALTEDDTYAWGRTQSEHADGWDWRRPDTIGRAATGLRARCDAADVYAAALLGDPLYRQRAVHTGHVVTGHVLPAENTHRHLRVSCDRMDARLRVGNAVTGWTGSPQDSADPFDGTVGTTEVLTGRLTLTLTGCSGTLPAPGHPVTLHPAPPSTYMLRSGRGRYRRLFATRHSWLTTGRTPTPTRREVPLEVLIAGADDS
jgi:hypothetical protein